MRINPAIFRAYDVRGVYPEEFDAETAKLLGFGFTSFIRKKSKLKKPILLIGRDIRASSDEIKRSFVEGVIRNGGDCIDLGVTTTPETMFIVAADKEADGGVMVTASHNPAEYNGIKFYLRGGEEVGLANGLKQIAALSRLSVDAKKLGQVTLRRDSVNLYIKRLHSLIPSLPSQKVLIDAAGGSTSMLLPELLSHYKIYYKPLFFTPDPFFKKHLPNPLDGKVSANMKLEMEKSKYNMGVAFDGDGDRAIFFDEKGNKVRPDRAFALIAAHELKKKKNLSFVFELTHSRSLRPFIETYGGKLFDSRVGVVSIRKEMQKQNASLGGELSGHVYHRSLFNVDSALYTMLLMIKIVGESERPLSRMLDDIPDSEFKQYSIKVEKPKDVILRVIRHFKNHVISRLDGVTIGFEGSWFNVRMSNTEPLIRVTIEADTSDLLEKAETEIDSFLKP